MGRVIRFPVNREEKARKALDVLNTFQSEVLKALYRIGDDGSQSKLTYEEVANIFDLTPEAIEAVEIGALRDLRRKRA